MSLTDEDIARNGRRWAVRRQFAKSSFMLLALEVLMPFVLLAFGKVDADTLEALAMYLATPTVALVTIIGVYIKFTTDDDMKMAEIASVAKNVS